LESCEEYFRSLIAGGSRGVTATALRSVLWAASLPYGCGVRLRNRLYDRGLKQSTRVEIPVVSVGNLTLGGTGKTPCVEYVARFYRRCGLRVAILSRGYGSYRGRNDEALVLEENLPDVPHLQDIDRVSLARTAIAELESEILVLDDGFQHRRLHRDLDLVLIDATCPWGHGHLFPRGFLREPPSSLRRAGVIVLTHCDQVDAASRQALRRSLSRRVSNAPIVETSHRPIELSNEDERTANLDLVSERPVAAFCGIGNPDSFRRTLMDQGARMQAFRSYPDHHAYTREDVDELRRWASRLPPDCIVVTTQKDYVKIRLSRLGGRPLLGLRIGLHIEAGREVFDSRLRSLVNSSP
jgi:tetraacyldisaccharide 4'-kinase